MPGIIAFNRWWSIASDELVIPFLIALAFRTVWLFVVVIAFVTHLVSHSDRVECNEGFAEFNLYYYIYMGVLLSSLINDIFVIRVSCRGTIFQVEKRKHMPKLLYFRLFLNFCEAVLGGVGAWLITHFKKVELHTDCFMVHWWLIEGVVTFNFIWVFFALLMLFYGFESTGKIWYNILKKSRTQSNYRSTDILNYRNTLATEYENTWRKACRLLFCCHKAESSRDNVLLFTSRIFADYFITEKDLVASDFLAGMILLRQKQKHDERKRVEENNVEYHQVSYDKKQKHVLRHQATASSKPFDMSSNSDVNVLEEITYFSRYASAMYGWPLYCYANSIPICTRPGFRLMSRVRCCGQCRKDPESYPKIADDNCCHCNYASQKAYLNVNDDCFIYVSYSDEVFQTPFNVIVDKYKGAVVISVRGTLSLKDVVTDLAIEEDPIPGGKPEWTGHRGFLCAAQAIKEIIEKENLMEQAFNFDTSNGSLNYRLVIVGHSLGAGTATLLSFLLRPQYPDLVCYAYGPSGSAVSYEASLYAHDFIYSVVLGKDLIARLNLNSVYEIKHSLLQVLEKTHLPKWQILQGCMCQCLLCCTRSSTHSYDEYFKNDEDLVLEPYVSANVKKLYMAGQVVHICKTKSIYPRYGRKKAEYKAFWSSAEDFQSILISNLMFKDHLPDNIVNALTSILPNVHQNEEIIVVGEDNDTLNIDYSGEDKALVEHDSA